MLQQQGVLAENIVMCNPSGLQTAGSVQNVSIVGSIMPCVQQQDVDVTAYFASSTQAVHNVSTLK